jgi:hypothetical protein
MKKPCARIPSTWFGLRHGKPISFWVEVYWEARRKGVRKSCLVGIKKIADAK